MINGLTLMDTKKTQTKPSSFKEEVFSTTNYDMFKGVVGNRPIYQPHVDRVRRSVLKKNMLARNPIKVNEDFQIIDGQHRLEVAKQLQIPIYYMIEPDGGLAEIQLLQTTRTWLTVDYLESFIAMKKTDYIKLKDFANEHRLSVSIAMSVLSQRFGGHSELIRDFKEGKFAIGDEKAAEDIANLISDVRRHSPDSAWTHRDCMKALSILYKSGHARLFSNQISTYQLTITRRQSVRDYLREFENVINSHREGKSIFLA